jgi:hypothetical protein
MPQNTDSEAGNAAKAQQAQGGLQSTSHLFLVRLWVESDSGGDVVWCGKVQHVTKGRPNQFRDWPALIDLFKAMLPDAERVRHHTDLEG